MYAKAPISLLSVGAVLGSPIHDPQGMLLLGAGITITQDFLTKLYRRGVRSVTVEKRDLIRLSGFAAKGMARHALPHRAGAKNDGNRDLTQDLDTTLEQTPDYQVVASDNPFSERVQARGTARYDSQQMDRVLDNYEQTVDQIGSLMQQLAKGETIAAEALQAVSDSCLKQAAEDLDLFACLGINPQESDSVFAHSANVAHLAIAVGATLGLDQALLRDLGTACLVNNAGMLQLDEKTLQSERVLDEREFAAIARHPIVSTDLLYKHMERVPLGVRMVVYQIHERCNGSGYPRGWTGDRIHPLAKIGAVADAYVALVSKRPHRPAMLPYHAVAKMLADVKSGLFDATVVRGLLHTIGLFPIGSFCELSDGCVAKTIRANGPAYDRPIVEAWPRTRRYDEPKVIDLTAEADLRIVKPLTNLHA